MSNVLPKPSRKMKPSLLTYTLRLHQASNMPSRGEECHSKHNAEHDEEVRSVVGEELRNAASKDTQRGIIAEGR